MLNIISVRNRPEYKEQAIQYFQRHWVSDETQMLYEDCISHCIDVENPLPDWYLIILCVDWVKIAGNMRKSERDHILLMRGRLRFLQIDR